MALVKKAHVDDLAPSNDPVHSAGVSTGGGRDADALRRKARTLAKQQQAAERVAAAAAQLASGINEASSASEELRRASDAIASGAEEASSAAQQSLQAVTSMATAISQQMQAAGQSQSRAEAMQTLAGKVQAEVTVAVSNVGIAAQRQAASVDMVGELERQAANIGDIVKAVARIADQTNLLALNAAIEAARAGEAGRSFSVVADEVRKLAQETEQAARRVSDGIAGFSGQIERDIKQMANDLAALNGLLNVDETIAAMDVLRSQLDEVLSFLAALSEALQSRNSEMAAEIGDALGDMQFQDITRQQLGTIGQGLDELTAHIESWRAQLTEGNRDDAESFTSRLSRLQSQYVMANQHADHRAALTGTDDIGVCHGARVELF